MWMRTQMSCQYETTSDDGGTTWSPAGPGPVLSPESPVAVARHKASGQLMMVWNHNRRAPTPPIVRRSVWPSQTMKGVMEQRASP